MGAPELPTDPGEEQLPTPTIEHPQIGNQSDSDDSDAYDGYQPLTMDDEPNDGNIVSTQSLNDNIDLTRAPEPRGDPNIPLIETADLEIVCQVWNEPRPQELQIDLDTTRTEQILKVMSSIQLPNITVPDWLVGVPEERWKHALLDRIHSNKQTGDNRITVAAATAAQNPKS